MEIDNKGHVISEMMENVEREELLKRLHSLPFCMHLSALTSEGCLELKLVSSQGTSYRWEGLDDFEFHAYCLNGLSKNKVAEIKEHIAAKSLYLCDLNSTQLKQMLPIKDKTKELSGVFADFLQLPDEKIESIFCYMNPDTMMVYVSDKPEKISDILNAQYPVDTPWEELNDEQLRAYLEEYEGNEYEIPFSYLD